MSEHLRTRPAETSSRGQDRRKLILLSLAAVAAAALPGRAQTDKKPFSPAELDQMLAPIALYSDALLSQILMAASYPLEIVEAARWSQANPNLKGDAAVSAVGDKSWDVSVKSLVAFPPVLAQLNEHLDWTQKLGDALIGQQAGRRRLDPAPARQGGRGRHAEDRQGADRHHRDAGQRDDLRHPADRSGGRLRADLRPQHRLWPVVRPGLSADLLSVRRRRLLTGLTWGLGFAAAGAMFGGWNWGYRGGSGNYVNINANRAVNIDRNFNRNNIGDGGRWQHQVGPSQGRGLSRQRHAPAIRPEPTGRRPAPAVPRPIGPGCAARRRTGRRCRRRPTSRRCWPRRRGSRGRAPGGAGPGGAGPGGRTSRRRGPGAARHATARAAGGGGGGGLGGVDRGQQVNRESQRGRASNREPRSLEPVAVARDPRWRRRRRSPAEAVAAVAVDPRRRWWRSGGGGGGGGGGGRR